MALIDKASLLMVPSVYEDGTLYNVLPSGNKAPDETGNHNGYDQTRADFTFSRGFNLTATRVNANGLIEKGRENTTTYSQDATNWTGVSLTRTSATESDPFSGSDAAEYEVSSISAAAYFYGTTSPSISSGQVVTGSVYIKNVDQRYIQLLFGSAAFGNGHYQNFDLETGTKGTSANIIDSSIEDIGGGWYRLSITKQATASASSGLVCGFVPSSSATRLQAPSILGRSLQAFGFQTELGLVATPYIETGATTATAGVLENTPRIDYSSGAGALLLEPQRTNLHLQSEYIHGWASKSNITTTANYTTSPEGVKNATRLQFTANGYIHNSHPAQVNGTQYTLSCYAKRNDSGTQSFGFFKDGSGAINSEMALTSEWKRFDYTYTASNGSQIGLAGNSGADVSVYGFQIESGASYPSSYVPTYGSAATRGADSCSVTGVSDVIGQTEGTLYFEVDLSDIETAGGYSGILLSDGTSSNQIYITYYSTGRVQTASIVSGSVVVNISDSNYGLSAGRHKFAVAYKANDYAFYIDGSSVGTNTSAAVPATSKFDLFFNSSGSLNHKEVTLFNERLSNTELATLTTL